MELFLFVRRLIESQLPRKLFYSLKFIFNLLLDKFNPLSEQFIVCVSVDGDGHFPGGIKKGFPVLVELLDKHGLGGKVTWFINEHRYKWTEKHPEYLKQLIFRQDDIQLHSHLEEKIFDNDRRTIYSQIYSKKAKLESFVGAVLKKPHKITCFRSGTLVKSQLLFEVLSDLNFRCDSSFLPGISVFYEKFGRVVGDPELPIQQREFFIDLMDFKKPAEKEGKILEFPVNNVLLHPRDILPFSNGNILYYNIFLHPYNLVKRNGKKNWVMYLYFNAVFSLLGRAPNVKFMTVREAEKICRKQLAQRLNSKKS